MWLVCVVPMLIAARLAAVEGPSKAGAKPPDNIVIAALPFTDSSPGGKYAPLAEAMGDMLISFMSRAEGIIFVERADLNKVLQEQRLSLSGALDDKTRANVGGLLGAKYILTGGVTVLDGALRLNAHLFEVETTRVARSEEAEGKVDDVVKPVAELARKLDKDLNVKLPELKESDIDRSPEANLHFMRGLGYYYSNMRDHAIAEFMKALALKPDHDRARYWNGVCYYDDKEYEHAKIEFDRFLKDFPKHELAPKAEEMLEVCTVEIQKRKPAEQGR